MTLSRENLLSSTHYGIKIYAWVLRQYFPGLVLYLSGKHCKPVKNPFNSGKETLLICIKNGCAVHSDSELPDFAGDVFEFAGRCLKPGSQEELYYMINQVLHLGLQVKVEEKPSWLQLPDDSWRPLISWYKAPVRNVYPSEEISLVEVHRRITGGDYKLLTEKLRGLDDLTEKRKLKANGFSYVTFSGTFYKRNEQALKQHSLLIAFDFDHLPNLPEVRQLLLQDEYLETELLFVSPSGDGLKWIVKCNLTETTHREFFEAVSKYLYSAYHLETDPSGRDVSRACFLPYDPQAFLHHRHHLITT